MAQFKLGPATSFEMSLTCREVRVLAKGLKAFHRQCEEGTGCLTVDFDTLTDLLEQFKNITDLLEEFKKVND